MTEARTRTRRTKRGDAHTLINTCHKFTYLTYESSYQDNECPHAERT